MKRLGGVAFWLGVLLVAIVVAGGISLVVDLRSQLRDETAANQTLREQLLDHGVTPAAPASEPSLLTGEPGPKGDPGPPGQDGDDGRPGVNGADGTPGAPGGDGAPGQDGANGAPGADGAAGSDGRDGPTGPTGATGPQGPVGETGPQGEQGPQGWPGPPPFSLTFPDGTVCTDPDFDLKYDCSPGG
jgi:hypothetical protein